MVQVTPYQGSSLAQTYLQGTQVKNQQDNQLAALAQRDAALAQDQSQFERTQGRADEARIIAAREQYAAAIPNAITAAQKLPVGSRLKGFQETLRPHVATMFQIGAADEDFAAGFLGVTEEDLADPAALEKWSAATKEVIGPDGKPAVAQFSDQGGSRIIPGVTPAPKSGETIEFGKDGTVKITRGGAGGSKGPLTSSSTSKLQGEIIADSELLAMTRNVLGTFRPEFQTVATRFDAAITGGKSKFGMDISPEDKKVFEDFVDYKANAANLQSKVINQLAGAAVSVSEAERINGFLIDPGTGLFDGGSPLEAEGKLRRYERNVSWAIARKQWFLKNGIEANEDNWNKHTLGDMPGIMKARHSELITEIGRQNPDKTGTEIEQMAIEAGKREFGLL